MLDFDDILRTGECTTRDVVGQLSFVITSKSDLFCMLTNKSEIWQS